MTCSLFDVLLAVGYGCFVFRAVLFDLFPSLTWAFSGQPVTLLCLLVNVHLP